MKPVPITSIYFIDGTLIDPATEGAEKWLENADYRGGLPTVYIKRGKLYYNVMLMTFDSATSGSEGTLSVVRAGLILVKKMDFEAINSIKDTLSTYQYDFFYYLKGLREIPKLS
jgi:hypothetical protein